MKKIISKSVLVLVISLFFFPSYIIVAQTTPIPDGGGSSLPKPDGGGSSGTKPSPKTNPSIGKLQNPLKANNVKEVIFLAVDIMVWLGVSFAILAIIWVGFKFILAQGDPTAVTEAKNWFFGIIVGLAILISAKVIVEIIQNTLKEAGVVNEKTFKI